MVRPFRTFSCAIFNIRQRHPVNKAVAATAKSGGDSFRKFETLVTSPGFSIALEDAINEPEFPEAKRLLRKVLRLLRIAVPKILWGSNECDGELHKLYGIPRCLGLPSMFITILKESGMSPIVVALGTRRLNAEASLQQVWDSTSAAAHFAQSVTHRPDVGRNMT